MFANHLKYNLVTISPDSFYIPNRAEFNTKLQNLQAQVAGLDFDHKLAKLKELNLISENVRSIVSDMSYSVSNLIDKREDAIGYITNKYDALIDRNDLTVSEKTKLLYLVSIMKVTANYVIENKLYRKIDPNVAQPRCFLTNNVFICWYNVINAYALLALAGSGTPAAAVLAGLATGAITLANILRCDDCDNPPPPCNAPTGASITMDGGCSLSGTISAFGGNDNGQGYKWLNINAYPTYAETSTASLHITQSDPSNSFGTTIGTKCGNDSYFWGNNLYSLIHDPGSPSYIQGNNYPLHSTIETYYILGNVNKPGMTIVASIQGSVGTVIGSVAGQSGYTIQVQWFRSGSGSIQVQTRSACGDLSSSVSLPVTVQ